MKMQKSTQRAFTLIELLVVIVVIGVLLVVAAPSFLGQNNKAYDSGAKQTLAVAYKAAKADTIREDSFGSYRMGAPLANAIVASEPQLTGRIGVLPEGARVPANGDVLGVCYASTPDNLLIVGRSGSGNTFLLKANRDGMSITSGTCPEPEEGNDSMPPSSTSEPEITGTIAANNTISVSNGGWTNSPSSFDYQWERCEGTVASPTNCVEVGTNEPTYDLIDADGNRIIRVTVTATNGDGSASAQAVAGPVLARPQLLTEIRIGPTSRFGLVETSSWANNPRFTYRWLRCDRREPGYTCTEIGTGSSYTPVGNGDEHWLYMVEVTATNAAGSVIATTDRPRYCYTSCYNADS
jgi:prepilin-type N-terminal cleavage/methylation domain-containing protein